MKNMQPEISGFSSDMGKSLEVIAPPYNKEHLREPETTEVSCTQRGARSRGTSSPRICSGGWIKSPC